MKTALSPQELFYTAHRASADAAAEENARLGDERSRGFDCGFAWVTIHPARGPFVKWLKDNKIGQTRSYSGGPGYGLWYSDLHDLGTQSISVHEAAVRAFVDVLKRHGIDASWSSRLD